MASNLLNISLVTGAGPVYSLTVNTVTGVVLGDHVVATLAADSTRGGIYRVSNLPGGLIIDVTDDLVPGGGAYGAPVAGNGAFWTPTSFGLSVQKPNGCPFWGDVTERDFLLLEADAVSGGMTAELLTYSDTANKILGPLSNLPTDPPDLSLFVLTGVLQEYTLDYTVREVVGGSAPGYYVCVSPTSTAPGGGAFGGGSNPGTGIASVLIVGDKVRVIYSV